MRFRIVTGAVSGSSSQSLRQPRWGPEAGLAFQGSCDGHATLVHIIKLQGLYKSDGAMAVDSAINTVTQHIRDLLLPLKTCVFGRH